MAAFCVHVVHGLIRCKEDCKDMSYGVIKPGVVARCLKGKIGIVCYRSINGYEKIWHGIKLDGTPWQSKKPAFVARSLSDYLQINYHNTGMMSVSAAVQISELKAEVARLTRKLSRADAAIESAISELESY